MTDAQLVAVAITVLTVLGGTLINNSRIGDVKEILRAEMAVLRIESRADTAALRSEMDKRFNSLDHRLDEFLRIIGDHETRLARLEQRPL